MRRLEVAGAKVGDIKAVLRKFPQAKKISFDRKDIETCQIYKPNPQISMLVLSFRDGRVWKMELHYFDGPTKRALRGAGG